MADFGKIGNKRPSAEAKEALETGELLAELRKDYQPMPGAAEGETTVSMAGATARQAGASTGSAASSQASSSMGIAAVRDAGSSMGSVAASPADSSLGSIAARQAGYSMTNVAARQTIFPMASVAAGEAIYSMARGHAHAYEQPQGSTLPLEHGEQEPEQAPELQAIGPIPIHVGVGHGQLLSYPVATIVPGFKIVEFPTLSADQVRMGLDRLPVYIPTEDAAVGLNGGAEERQRQPVQVLAEEEDVNPTQFGDVVRFQLRCGHWATGRVSTDEDQSVQLHEPCEEECEQYKACKGEGPEHKCKEKCGHKEPCPPCRGLGCEPDYFDLFVHQTLKQLPILVVKEGEKTKHELIQLKRRNTVILLHADVKCPSGLLTDMPKKLAKAKREKEEGKHEVEEEKREDSEKKGEDKEKKLEEEGKCEDGTKREVEEEKREDSEKKGEDKEKKLEEGGKCEDGTKREANESVKNIL